jgi:hypothetical protein
MLLVFTLSQCVVYFYIYGLFNDPVGSADERGAGEAGTNYRGPAIRKGAWVPTILRMFFYFSVVSLFVDCKN